MFLPSSTKVRRYFGGESKCFYELFLIGEPSPPLFSCQTEVLRDVCVNNQTLYVYRVIHPSFFLFFEIDKALDVSHEIQHTSVTTKKKLLE